MLSAILTPKHYRIRWAGYALAEPVERQADAGNNKYKEADIHQHSELGGGVPVDLASFVFGSAKGGSEDEQVENALHRPMRRMPSGVPT